jgi:hypothetical protein
MLVAGYLLALWKATQLYFSETVKHWPNKLQVLYLFRFVPESYLHRIVDGWLQSLLIVGAIKHINTLCGESVEFLNVKSGGTYVNHWTLNS